jgi:heme-degrading monooxygenase HmoA
MNHRNKVTIGQNKKNTINKIVEMDERVKFLNQIQRDAAPVILINKFNVKSEHIDQFLSAWDLAGSVMKRQPGYISAQLHRGIADSSVFINYAIWESTQQFRVAFNNPEFQSILSKFPPGTVASPHLFKKIAVPGICVD